MRHATPLTPLTGTPDRKGAAVKGRSTMKGRSAVIGRSAVKGRSASGGPAVKGLGTMGMFPEASLAEQSITGAKILGQRSGQKNLTPSHGCREVSDCEDPGPLVDALHVSQRVTRIDGSHEVSASSILDTSPTAGASSKGATRGRRFFPKVPEEAV